MFRSRVCIVGTQEQQRVLTPRDLRTVAALSWTQVDQVAIATLSLLF